MSKDAEQIDIAKVVQADLKKAGGVWPAIVKKADGITPIYLSKAKGSIQKCAVFLFAVAFILGFVLNLMNNTVNCTKENGCISCTVQSGTFDQSSYSEGCEPIAVPHFEVQKTRCSFGVVENQKAYLNTIADTTSLAAKMSKACLASASKNCHNGQALNDPARPSKPNAQSCLHGMGDSGCMYLTGVDPNTNNAYARLNNQAIVENDATVCTADNIQKTILANWEKTQEVQVLRTSIKYNEQNNAYDVDSTKLQAILGEFARALDKSMQTSTVMNKIVDLASVMCWIDQLVAEAENPATYPGGTDIVGFAIIQMPDGTSGLYIRPGGYATRCGMGMVPKKSESQTSVATLTDAYIVALEEQPDAQGNPTGSGVFNFIVMPADGLLCQKSNQGNVCDQERYIVPTTGEYNCCARKTLGTALGGAYAFASLCLSVAGFAVAAACATALSVCGRDCVCRPLYRFRLLQ